MGGSDVEGVTLRNTHTHTHTYTFFFKHVIWFGIDVFSFFYLLIHLFIYFRLTTCFKKLGNNDLRVDTK